MIDLSRISNESVLGRALRVPLKLIPGRTVVPILQGPLRGARWIVGSGTHGCWLGSYETPTQRACLVHVRPGMVAYDLGANVGFYTLLFSRLVGPGGAVHAFEPAERNLQLLKRHVGMNGATNVRIHPVAVGRTIGAVTFDPGSGPSMGHVVSHAGSTTVTVPAVSPDDFVYGQGHPAPDVVKMDIEGGEVEALAGMNKVLQARRPTLLVSVHGRDLG